MLNFAVIDVKVGLAKRGRWQAKVVKRKPRWISEFG